MLNQANQQEQESPASPHDLFSRHSHSFNQGVAITLGIEAAIVLSHIIYWLQVNAAKPDEKTIEGKYWMYETQKQISDFLGYLSEDKVCRAIKKLTESGILIKGNFNKHAFERTIWYTLFDQDIITNFRIKKISPIPRRCGMDSARVRNGFRARAESSYTIEEQHKKKQQQQACAREIPEQGTAAAVFFDQSKKSANPIPSAKVTEQPHHEQKPEDRKQETQEAKSENSAAPAREVGKIHACLQPLDLPAQDKIEITQDYSEDTVAKAIAWALHPETEIRKGLAPAIKWACRTSPEMPKSKESKKAALSPVDYAGHHRSMWREIWKNFIWPNPLLKDQFNDTGIEYLELTRDGVKDKLYYRDSSFIDQLECCLRKMDCFGGDLVKFMMACKDFMSKLSN